MYSMYNYMSLPIYVTSILWLFVYLFINTISETTFEPKLENNKLVRGELSTHKIIENTMSFIHAGGAITLCIFYLIDYRWKNYVMVYGTGYFLYATLYQYILLVGKTFMKFENKMSNTYLIHHIITFISLSYISQPTLEKYLILGYLFAEVSNIPMYIAYNQLNNVKAFEKIYKEDNTTIYARKIRPSSEVLYAEAIIYTYSRIFLGGYLIGKLCYTTSSLIIEGILLYMMSIIWCIKLWKQI